MKLESACGVCECVTDDCGPCFVVDGRDFLMRHDRSYDVFLGRRVEWDKEHHLGTFKSKAAALGALMARRGTDA